MLKLSFTLLIVPAIIIAVTSFLYSKEIMSLLYKSNTGQSSEILSILMIGFTGIASAYIFGTLLTANGNMKQLNLMAFSGVILNVVLNIILIPRYHAYGSAYASMTTQILTGAAQCIIAIIIFKIRPRLKYLIQLLLFTGFTIAIGIVSKYLENWIYGLLIMVTGSLIFAFISGLLNIKNLIEIVSYKQN